MVPLGVLSTADEKDLLFGLSFRHILYLVMV